MIKSSFSKAILLTFVIIGCIYYIVHQCHGNTPNDKYAKPIMNNAARAITLEGTRNTRDMGGIPLKKGTFKKGLVYRSGALCYITEKDAARLNKLKIKTTIDLRIKTEIIREGKDKESFSKYVANKLHLPMICNYGLERMAYLAYLGPNNTQAQLGFFSVLADRNRLPLLFHCSAGKDRTGILSCLMLELLGCDRTYIMDDYLQSRRNSSALRVEPEWLEAVFETVDRKGGIEPYLTKLGVPKESFAKIRENLIDTTSNKKNK